MKFRSSTSAAAIAAYALTALTLAPAAKAQTAPPAPSGSTAAPSTDNTQGIQDIIVTASRRETTLQKTAIPVTAITGDSLRERGVTNVQALTNLAPALKVGGVGGGSMQITTRGVGNFGGNDFNEPGVSVNLDGVYLARSYGLNGIFYDVARVELLKGPQGTLYGRNTTGGVLSIITNDPKDKLGGDLTVEGGNYGLKRVSGDINIPIAEGVALRAAGQAIDRDGYLSDGYNDDKGYAGRVKLKLEPTSRLSILLEANFSATQGRGNASVFVPFVDPNNPYVGPSDPRSNAILSAVRGLGPLLPKFQKDGFLDNKARGLQGTVNYDFGGMKATLIVDNQRNTQHYLQYNSGFQVFNDTRKTPNYYTTAELRLASTGSGPLKWVVGGFYYHDDLRTNAFVNQGFTFADSRDVAIHTASYSGFGEATYAITHGIRLTAGGRYTSDKKSETGVTLGPVSPCGPPSSVIVDPIRGAVCSTPDTGAATFSKFTYKLGAEADLGPRSLLYANYTTGFKSGGFFAAPNASATGSFPSNAYHPEEISAWTVGSKNRFFNNKLQLNAEGFYWKYKNKQISHLGFVPPNNLILLVDNAASATLYGAELEAVWQPTRHDEFGADVQYLHAKYDTFTYSAVVPGWAQPAPPGAPAPIPVTGCPFSPTVGIGGAPRGRGVPGLSTINCSGKVLSLSPTWTVNLNYRHTFDLPDGSTLVPSVATNIESGYWAGEDFYTGEYQKPFTSTDVMVTWTMAGKALSITGFVNNIENVAVKQSATVQSSALRTLANLRAPRTYGVRASVHF